MSLREAGAAADIPQSIETAFAAAGVPMPDPEFGGRVASGYPLLLAYDGLDELQPDSRLETAAEIAANVERPGSV
ncbi:MAG: hypothetical protein CYG59_24995, partial [Chloroflexi bacterium]